MHRLLGESKTIGWRRDASLISTLPLHPFVVLSHPFSNSRVVQIVNTHTYTPAYTHENSHPHPPTHTLTHAPPPHTHTHTLMLFYSRCPSFHPREWLPEQNLTCMSKSEHNHTCINIGTRAAWIYAALLAIPSLYLLGVEYPRARELKTHVHLQLLLQPVLSQAESNIVRDFYMLCHFPGFYGYLVDINCKYK